MKEEFKTHNKVLFICHFIYYILVPLVYLLVFCICFSAFNFIMELDKAGNDYMGNTVVILFYALSAFAGFWIFAFIITPVICAVLMRFSFLKAELDPIAAFEIPLTFYLILTVKFGTPSAFFELLGWNWILYMSLVFAFGLLCSFSLKRKQGQSISYRIIDKLFSKKRNK